MSELHFPNLTIKGFRGIKELTIPNLGRVNLITGKNNTGKSTVLEALRIILHDAEPWVILDTLEFREKDIASRREVDTLTDLEVLSYISVLFHGFPQKLRDFSPIVVTTTNGSKGEHLELKIQKISENSAPQMGLSPFYNETLTIEDGDSEMLLLVKKGEFSVGHRLRNFLRNLRSTRVGHTIIQEPSRMPCVLLDPYAGESTDEHADLWDSVVLTELEREVVEALRLINSNISAISMVRTSGSSHVRRAIVRAEGIPRPVPLRSFGDGMNRLFGIALSLANAEGGVLLIDEFENGLHFSIQPDVWRMIFNMSERLNIQVFATTHSRDTVHAFQKAASESPEEGALIHLTSRDGKIVPTVFTEQELKIVARDDVEVR